MERFESSSPSYLGLFGSFWAQSNHNGDGPNLNTLSVLLHGIDFSPLGAICHDCRALCWPDHDKILDEVES